MGKATDIRPISVKLFFLPIRTRIPLKFGPETLTEVTCARACVQVTDRHGRTAQGWGETPLSVQWVWPSQVPFEERHQALKQFCIELAELWSSLKEHGHPIELGHDFQETVLPGWLNGFNQRRRRGKEPMPWLAALLCCSVFDVATHDAFGQLHQRPIYETYTADWMNRDLGSYLQAAEGSEISFRKKYPAEFLRQRPVESLPAWHLVGGLDPIDVSELTGDEPKDGYPVLLRDWIRKDGLQCVKIKLRGNDRDWDLRRIVSAGTAAIESGVTWLSADFNCTVQDPEYVNSILDQLRDDHARIYGMILYVEQPFPYDLEAHEIDVRSVAGRKPLFLDESAHDWRAVRHGRELGWSGVALKTCKTQTGAILSACWARAHGMTLMVQDLSNPMLAAIPHLLLAAHVETIMGVETNAMQFYPEASKPEAEAHPGIYRRVDGRVSVASAMGPGFGYQVERIRRKLPAAAVEA